MAHSPETTVSRQEKPSLLSHFDRNKLRVAATSTALALWLSACARIDTANGATLDQNVRGTDAVTLQADLENTSLTQEDIESLAAQQAAVEATPTRTPTARPTQTKEATNTPQRVALAEADDLEQQLPTPTPTTPRTPTPRPSATPRPTATEVAPVAEREVTLAVMNGSTNIRGGAGTNFPIVETGVAGQEFELTGNKEQVGNFTWHEVDLGAVDGWVRGDLFTTRTEPLTNAGPNTGGAVATPEQITLPTSTPTTTAETSTEQSAETITTEELAEMIETITLGGNKPAEFSPEITPEEGERLINELYAKLLEIQTGLTPEKLAEIIKNNEEVTLRIPAQTQLYAGGRSPSIAGEPQEITVNPAEGISYLLFDTQASLRQFIEQTMVINGQHDWSGNYPTDLRLTDKETNEIVGSFVTVSTSGTHIYTYRDRDGKLTIANGGISGGTKTYGLYQSLITIAYADLLVDTIQANNLYTEHLLPPSLGQDYIEDYRNGVVKMGVSTVTFPEQFDKQRFLTTDEGYTKYEFTMFKR